MITSVEQLHPQVVSRSRIRSGDPALLDCLMESLLFCLCRCFSCGSPACYADRKRTSEDISVFAFADLKDMRGCILLVVNSGLELPACRLVDRLRTTFR